MLSTKSYYGCLLAVQLVEVTKQPPCMKGACRTNNRFLWAVAVHTCRLLSNFNQSSCNTETGQHSPLQGSCCPVSALQLLFVCYCVLSTAT